MVCVEIKPGEITQAARLTKKVNAALRILAEEKVKEMDISGCDINTCPETLSAEILVYAPDYGYDSFTYAYKVKLEFDIDDINRHLGML